MESISKEIIDISSDSEESLISTISEEETPESDEFDYPPFCHSIRPASPLKGKRKSKAKARMKELKRLEDMYESDNQLPPILSQTPPLETKNELKQIYLIENQPINEFQGPILKEHQLNSKSTILMEEHQEESLIESSKNGNSSSQSSERKQWQRLGQDAMASVVRYVNLDDILNIVRTNKTYRCIPELFHYNPFLIDSTRKREFFPNINEWRVYSTSCGEMENDFKIINIGKQPIKKIRMEDPMDIYEGKKFLRNHPELEPTMIQWKERLVMDSKTNTKENKTRINKLLDPDTTEIIPYYNCNKLLRILDLSTSKLRYIPEQTFENFNDLRKVTLPNTIQSLGNACFKYCYRLSQINLPQTLTSLGNFCFCECHSVTNLQLPSHLETIGEHCFHGCGFSTITIPSLITTLREGTFYSCNNLKIVTFETTHLEKLDDLCFAMCYDLKSIDLPNTITSIGFKCFAFDCHLTDVHLSTNLRTIANYAFYNCPIRTITFPTSLVSIGAYSFAVNQQLPRLRLSKDLKNLEYISGTWDKGRKSLPKKDIEIIDLTHSD